MPKRFICFLVTLFLLCLATMGMAQEIDYSSTFSARTFPTGRLTRIAHCILLQPLRPLLSQRAASYGRWQCRHP